jgi:hypothetical protein
MSGIWSRFGVRHAQWQFAIGVLVALVVIAVLSAGGSHDAPRTAALAASRQTRDPNCIAVHPTITRRWNERIHDAAIASAAASRSDDFEQVYMIAGLIVDPSNDGKVGVWATSGSPRDRGVDIMAVDEIARSISGWTVADASHAAITPATHGVAEAKECLRAQTAP